MPAACKTVVPLSPCIGEENEGHPKEGQAFQEEGTVTGWATSEADPKAASIGVSTHTVECQAGNTVWAAERMEAAGLTWYKAGANGPLG